MGFRINALAVVKMYREDECPDTGDGSEDSDCESILEQVTTSSPEAQVDEKEEKEPESIPVLTLGSFARYMHDLK